MERRRVQLLRSGDTSGPRPGADRTRQVPVLSAQYLSCPVAVADDRAEVALTCRWQHIGWASKDSEDGWYGSSHQLDGRLTAGCRAIGGVEGALVVERPVAASVHRVRTSVDVNALIGTGGVPSLQFQGARGNLLVSLQLCPGRLEPTSTSHTQQLATFCRLWGLQAHQAGRGQRCVPRRFVLSGSQPSGSMPSSVCPAGVCPALCAQRCVFSGCVPSGRVPSGRVPSGSQHQRVSAPSCWQVVGASSAANIDMAHTVKSGTSSTQCHTCALDPGNHRSVGLDWIRLGCIGLKGQLEDTGMLTHQWIVSLRLPRRPGIDK